MSVVPPAVMPSVGFGKISVSTGSGPAHRSVGIGPHSETLFKVSNQGFGNPPTFGYVSAKNGAAMITAAKAFVDSKPTSDTSLPTPGAAYLRIDLTWDGKDISYAEPYTSASPQARALAEATMLLANQSGPGIL